MKQLIITICILLISLDAFCQGFNSIHTPDGNYVIAAGSQGLVFRSSNGGASWESFNIGSVNLTGVFSLGNSYWITGADGRVYIGNTASPSYLTARNVDNSTSLKSVFFISPSIGFVCGSGGKVYKTIDGGNTWSISNTGISSVNLNSIHFLNSTNGAVCGDNGNVFVSTDGGASWSSQPTGTSYNLLRIRYLMGGIVAAGEFGTLLQKGTSGSFSSIDSRIISDIRGISGTDINNVHLCGGGGFIRNNKSGNSLYLNFEQNPMAANLSDIYYMDNNNGYAVSSLNKAVIKTTDGGSNWNLTAGTTVTYSWTTKLTNGSGIGNGFYIPPPQYRTPANRDVIFICQGNKVYRSADKGDTWVQIATVPGSSCHSFYISPLDTNLMIASMGSFSGTVVRSTDYGQNWTTVWSGALTSYGMPLEMDWNQPNVMYLGPDNAALLKSTNFGLNWTTLSTISFQSPCDMAIFYKNSSVIYMADQSTARLLKSTDGGVNWTVKNTVSTSEIPMIGMSQLDTNLAFHTAWSSGGVFKTVNGGENFSNVTTTGSAWGCDIAKDDPTAFSFITYGTAGYLTTNSGSSFSGVTSIGSSNAGVLYLDKGTLLGQGSNGVYKLNITYNVTSTPVVITGISNQISGSIPVKFNLSQNYPNPFNPSTKIQYDIPQAGFVSLKIYSLDGKESAVLQSGYMEAGSYSIDFNASGLASGIYFYKLETAGITLSKKMILAK